MAAFQEGDFEFVFDNFSADGLNNTVDSAAPDNGVGVEWRRRPRAGRDQRHRRPVAARRPGAARHGPAPPCRGGGPGERSSSSCRRPSPGKTVNVSVRKGRIFVRIPPSKNFVELTDPTQIPVGATIDTRKGRVNLVSAADQQGTPQLAWFYDGVFKIGQTGGAQADHRPHARRGARALPAEPAARVLRRGRRPASCGARARARSARPASSARRPSAARSGS